MRISGEIEKLAAEKFVETKGMEYLDSNKYTMGKSVYESEKEIEFHFYYAKARQKCVDEIITIDEAIPWDEEVTISIDKVTLESRATVEKGKSVRRCRRIQNPVI